MSGRESLIANIMIGYKQSGIGRELGEAGLHAYSQTKAVHVNLSLKL